MGAPTAAPPLNLIVQDDSSRLSASFRRGKMCNLQATAPKVACARSGEPPMGLGLWIIDFIVVRADTKVSSAAQHF